jgi:DNA-binding GntR family transcriptional regulator
MVKRLQVVKNLRQLVYESVRDFVTSSNVPPGAKIDEEKLADELGVSKTPIREALSKLAHDGFVDIIPNRGSFKATLSKENIREVMELRDGIEGIAAYLAAQHVTPEDIKRMKDLHKPYKGAGLMRNFGTYVKADQEFHAILFRLSGNTRIIQMIDAINRFNIQLREELFRNPKRVRISIKGHEEIIKALEKKDGDKAERILKTSIRETLEYLLNEFSRNEQEALSITEKRST